MRNYADLLRTLPLIAILCASTSAERIITTVVGTERVFQGEGGPATQADIAVLSVTVDLAGNVFLADPGNNVVARISPDGTLSVVAGNGIEGFSGDGGPATQASLSRPTDVAVDTAGNIFIADQRNNRVRQVDRNGIIRTVAGNGKLDSFAEVGRALNVSILPTDVAVDAAGNLFISDAFHRIRKVTPDGTIRTLAGNGSEGYSGDGGPANRASLASPIGLAVDAAGNLYFADSRNYRVRVVSPGGVIRTIAGDGDGRYSGENVPAIRASLYPTGVAVDRAGNLFIADSYNNRVRRVTDGIIRTVAGNGTPLFSGDGGPATDASLSGPEDVGVDETGNLYIADSANRRIRKVSPDGIIRTVAGNRTFRFSGDGGPATSAVLSFPIGLATDAAGNLFIGDRDNHRVRQVNSDGIIRTVAGNGEPRFAGDDGPATEASLRFPSDVAVDASGNLFIADQYNNRVRQVSPAGIIRTIAGDGNHRFFGEDSPAAIASLADPVGLAVDTGGNLFIADSGNHRIRQINPAGVIRTVAGNGSFSSAGDGGRATDIALFAPSDVAVDSAGKFYISDSGNNLIRQVSADGSTRTAAVNGTSRRSAFSTSLYWTEGVTVDRAGNLFFADTLNNRIRELSSNGIVRTVAGNGTEGFSGDGAPAIAASLNRPGSVEVDAAGNLFIADTRNHRIRVVLAEPPRFEELRPAQAPLHLSGRSRGAPASESFVVSTSATGLTLLSAVSGVSFRVSVSNGGEWLTVSPDADSTPRLVRVSADPQNLAPGEYEGLLVVSMPHASPAEQKLSVRFSVGPAIAPKLNVHTSSISFTYPAGTPARVESFVVSNSGGGDMPFTVTTVAGREWLQATPGSATARPGNPVTIEVRANPGGLAVGTYTGRLRVEAAAEGSPVDIPVIMTISSIEQAILLSQTGLSFTAVKEGGIVPPQTFGVLNLGRGSMGWSVSTCTLTRFSCEWLRVTPDSGASDPSAGIPQVTVQVNQQELEPGQYYGLVEVRSAGAANTPQVVTVFVDVLPEGSDPGAALTDNELVFTAVAGAGSPSSQDVYAYNVAARPKSYRSSRTIGAGRLQILPAEGALDPQAPKRIVVQPFTDDVPAGEHEGNVTFQFSDGRVQEIGVKLVVTEEGEASQSKSQRRAEGECTPKKLLPVMRTLGSGFAVSAGWPVALQAEVKDDCGQPMRDGTVVVGFSNGDEELRLTSLRNGRWDGTWKTNPSQLSNVTLHVEARQPAQGLEGRRDVPGRLRSLKQAPVLTREGVTSSAGATAHQPLAPGSLISLSGSRLSEGEGAAEGWPLPEELQSMRALIAGIPMPLLFASDGLVNAIVPYGIAVNTRHQILVQRGPTLAEVVSVDVAAAQPAIFRTSSGGTQGRIYRCLEQGNCALLADANEPATAGETVLIQCAGLGEVDPPVDAAARVPESPSSRPANELSVRIGGRAAQVLSSVLAPGSSGLYHVYAVVPEGVEPGSEVSVTLHIAGQSGPPVTMAVR